MKEQLRAVGRGASLPDCECAPLGGSGRLVALAVVSLGAAALLLSRVLSPERIDPLAPGTIFFHGALIVAAAVSAALALVALARRALSGVTPCAVMTPALVVETGTSFDPVHVRRLDQVIFERNELDRLVLRFRDGEIVLPRIGDRTGALAVSVWRRLQAMHANPRALPVEDDWTRALDAVTPGVTRSRNARITVVAVLGALAGLAAWGQAWRSSFASREATAWAGVEREDTSHAYALYGDFVTKATGALPGFVLAASGAHEHGPLARTREDDRAYSESERAGTAAAVKKYLDAHASGAHAAEAALLRETRLFSEAEGGRSALLLRGYLAEHPTGPRADKARALLLALLREKEETYRRAGKEWVERLLVAMRGRADGIVPTVIETSYERDGPIFDALAKAFARAFPGELLAVERAPDQTPAPRLVVTHELRETGGTYLSLFGGDIPLPGTARVPVQVLDVTITLELPGEKLLACHVVAEPPAKLSVKTRDFLKAHPDEVVAAMQEALYAELERLLEAELPLR